MISNFKKSDQIKASVDSYATNKSAILVMMENESENLKKQYHGYERTPPLWHGDAVYGLEQLKISNFEKFNQDLISDYRLRLGHRIEQFVFFDLERASHIELIASNIQIQDGKRTIGELDALIKIDDQISHLEIVYKFYLYDPKSGSSELDHWIGPNRKDTLLQKLNKLKQKQFPLRRHPQTKLLLREMQLNAESMHQHVHFQAQLFVPFNSEHLQFELLNDSCIKGFYIKYIHLHQFKDCEFYIPTKLNWLCEVESSTEWQDYQTFYNALKLHLQVRRSPLCWIKFEDGQVKKMFVVWWDK